MMVDARFDGDSHEIVAVIRISEADMERVSFDPFQTLIFHQAVESPAEVLDWLSLIAHALQGEPAGEQSGD